jgi:solute:Na+ symporter, SSS family
VVIVGGLYWKRGTAAAGWTAMTVGVIASLFGLFLLETKPETVGIHAISSVLSWSQIHITGQDLMGISSAVSVVSYILVSLMGRTSCDLDTLLHRGKASDAAVPAEAPSTGLALFRMGPEYTRFDKALYLASYSWMGMCGVVFLGVLLYHQFHGISMAGWLRLWYVLVWLAMGLGAIIVCWFAVGGTRDLFDMFRRLRTAVRDHTDDGMVRDRAKAEALAPPREQAKV